jgi:hypothetical protein
MNIDTKFFNKILANKFNNTLKVIYLDRVSFQGCKPGSTYTN